MIITTTSSLQGYEITEYLGLAYGLSVNYNNGMGKTGMKLWGKTLEELTASLTDRAAEMGADAVIGVSYFQDKSISYAYGTAVRAKKI